MTFRVSIPQIELQRALKRVSSVAARFTGRLHFSVSDDGNLQISAHNDEIAPSMTIAYQLKSIICDPFEPFCVNSHRLESFVNASMASSDIVMSEGKRLSVKSSNGSMYIAISKDEFYPTVFKPLEESFIIKMNHAELRNILSVSTLLDPSDPTTLKNSVCLLFGNGHIRALATNGFRAAYVWQENILIQDKFDVLIKADILQQVQKNFWDGELSIYFDRAIGKMFFVADDFYIYGSQSAVTAGSYPKETLLEWMTDELGSGVLVPGELVKNQLRACATMTEDGRTFVRVKFETTPDSLVVSSKPNESGEMRFVIPIQNQLGDNVEFYANSTYVRHAIALIDQIDNDGFDNIQIRLGTEKDFIFVVKSGLNARYAFAKMEG